MAAEQQRAGVRQRMPRLPRARLRRKRAACDSRFGTGVCRRPTDGNGPRRLSLLGLGGAHGSGRDGRARRPSLRRRALPDASPHGHCRCGTAKPQVASLPAKPGCHVGRRHRANHGPIICGSPRTSFAPSSVTRPSSSHDLCIAAAAPRCTGWRWPSSSGASAWGWSGPPPARSPAAAPSRFRRRAPPATLILPESQLAVLGSDGRRVEMGHAFSARRETFRGSGASEN